MADAPRPPAPKLYFEIFAASLAAILLEIAYTRIFSFKLFYYFTYVIIGVALMGLGAGGVLLAVSRRLREADLTVLIPRSCLVGGLAVLVGYAYLGPGAINVSQLSADGFELVKLAFACLVLSIPFLAVGLVISAILSARPEAANRLYGTDLVGAALGCTLSIPIITTLDPPRAVVLAGLILVAAGLPMSVGKARQLAAGVVATLVLAVPVVSGQWLADPVVDENKMYEEYRRADLLRHKQWSPIFRVDVMEHPWFPGDVYLVYHDGLPGSGLRKFDGDLSKHERMRTDPRALPFQVLGDEPEVLIVGSAGGHEVLASLFFGAKHVTGVELNPAQLALLETHFADVTGHLPDHPKVDFVNGDARWFLAQDEGHYDLIWYVAPDSYAAMNAATSGAFVLSESYLYTVEMLRQAFRRLTDGGVICAQFGEMNYHEKPNRTTRFLTTARAALQAEGVEDVSKHVIVGQAPGWPPQLDSVMLISKTPYTPDRVQRFLDYLPTIDQGKILYAPGMPPNQLPVVRAVALSEEKLERWLDEYPYQIDAVYDDSPFFWHFASFSKALGSDLKLEGGMIDFEDAVGEKTTVYLLVVVVILAAVFLLLPFFTIRETWAKIPGKGRIAIYFASLGLGFMFVEVPLIQRFTLLVGYPTYSLTVTLFAILVFSGIGSMASARYADRPRRAWAVLFGLLVGLVLLYMWALPVIIDACVGYALAVRFAVTVALLAPLGLCLGAFLPLGLGYAASLTDHKRELVAWAWAVNGFFSVMASVLATMVAMIAGFTVVMALALAIYAVGVGAMLTAPEGKAA